MANIKWLQCKQHIQGKMFWVWDGSWDFKISKFEFTKAQPNAKWTPSWNQNPRTSTSEKFKTYAVFSYILKVEVALS